MSNTVLVFQRADGWVVRLTEGDVVSEREFGFEKHARAWADGQRIRLKLAHPSGIEAGDAAQALRHGPPGP